MCINILQNSHLTIKLTFMILITTPLCILSLYLTSSLHSCLLSTCTPCSLSLLSFFCDQYFHLSSPFLWPPLFISFPLPLLILTLPLPLLPLPLFFFPPPLLFQPPNTILIRLELTAAAFQTFQSVKNEVLTAVELALQQQNHSVYISVFAAYAEEDHVHRRSHDDGEREYSF